MAKRTKASKGEIVQVYYGINRKTFKVESVSLTRGGTLTKWFDNGSFHSSPVHPSNKSNPAAEVVVVYNLIDVFAVLPEFESNEFTKTKIEALKMKAAEMKKAAEAAKDEKDKSS